MTNVTKKKNMKVLNCDIFSNYKIIRAIIYLTLSFFLVGITA